MATMENATVNEKLDLCRKILIRFGSISRGVKLSPDSIKLRQEVSDFITKTPGHAYEMRRRMLERQAINLGEIEGEYSMRKFDYLSKMIGELRSVETIRVLAELLPEMMTYEEKRRKRLKCRLLDVYADLWRRRALLMAAGVSSPARFGPYSTRAFIASVR